MPTTSRCHRTPAKRLPHGGCIDLRATKALVRECCSSGTQCRCSWRSDAGTNTIFSMRSRVHPKYKTKYHVCNWPEYECALVRRGDVTFWLSADAIAAWKPAPSGRRGAQRKFSDCAIETALTLRLVFRLPLRQAEGFLRSVLSMMRVDLDAPDHTTLSRRSPGPLCRVSPHSGQRTHPPLRRLHRTLDRR